MADVELVIKIPKSVYNYVKQLGNIPTIDTQCVANAIFDGTPLQKGHGRLIDADDIDNHIIGHVDTRSCPTIVKADKEESEVNE